MNVDQTEPARAGAIREILSEELDRISGGWYFDPIDSPSQQPHFTPGAPHPRTYRPLSSPS
jgi:hypothetical protein